MSFLQREWKFIAGLLLLLSAFGIVYYEYKQFIAGYKQPPAQAPVVTVNTSGQVSKPGETQIVYVKGDSSDTKEIVYVPKEIDTKTNQPEKTDVQFGRRDSKVYVVINGKEFEVPVDVKEDAKFEKGKLVITEKTEMRVNITAPKPAFNVGLGRSNNGPAAQLNGPLIKNVSWWVYGDKKTVAGGLQFPITK